MKGLEASYFLNFLVSAKTFDFSEFFCNGQRMVFFGQNYLSLQECLLIEKAVFVDALMHGGPGS